MGVLSIITERRIANSVESVAKWADAGRATLVRLANDLSLNADSPESFGGSTVRIGLVALTLLGEWAAKLC